MISVYFLQLSCLTFMAPRPQTLGSISDAVFLPLQGPVWLTWLASIVFATLACRVLHAITENCGFVADPRAFE